ncbi:PLDc N-terminal domain-containing protein [Curtobacterium ammoniigenes]|uniref:PLDc N-terminal domain-containing protein n=1 Tax=Curtobacterium ammoniigenes TaxID=395387 RepID=UPI00082CEDBF|nr:PLDc N-terminal domain-containing protein [Curtobacterium ammoniigenes]
MQNPTIPPVYDATWTAVLVAAAILLVAAIGVLAWALVSITQAGAFAPPDISPLWVIVIVLVPFVGPLIWLTSGRSLRRRLT